MFLSLCRCKLGQNDLGKFFSTSDCVVNRCTGSFTHPMNSVHFSQAAVWQSFQLVCSFIKCKTHTHKPQSSTKTHNREKCLELLYVTEASERV